MRQYFITSLLIHIIGVICFLLLSYMFVPKIYKYTLNVSVVSSNDLSISQPKPYSKVLTTNNKEQPLIKKEPKPPIKQPIQTPLPVKPIETPPQQPNLNDKTSPTKSKALLADNKNFLAAIQNTKQDNSLKEVQQSQIKKEAIPAVQPNKIEPKEAPLPSETPQAITKKEEPVIINKDNNFTNLLTNTAKAPNNTPTQDILSDNSPLNNEEKSTLITQLNKCWLNLGPIKDKTITIQLQLKMNSDATINNIEFIADKNLDLSQQELENLRVKIINLFKNPQCARLALPANKFALWETFSIKLNIRGFFD